MTRPQTKVWTKCYWQTVMAICFMWHNTFSTISSLWLVRSTFQWFSLSVFNFDWLKILLESFWLVIQSLIYSNGSLAGSGIICFHFCSTEMFRKKFAEQVWKFLHNLLARMYDFLPTQTFILYVRHFMSMYTSHLKGLVYPQKYFCYHCLTLMLFQSFTNFSMCNSKDILKNVWIWTVLGHQWLTVFSNYISQ